MSTIIRAADSNHSTHGVAFNFDDMSIRANQYLAKIRDEAGRIVVKAQQEADLIRKRAETEGRQAAMATVEEMVRKQLTTVIPALKEAVKNIHNARHDWLAHWEGATVHLAAAIAKRLIRRELNTQPEITLSLVREALELAAGSSQLRISLNPQDFQALGEQVRMVVEELSPHIETELKADAEVTPGGCRVETRFGVIDQQFEAQLQRIEEELKQ
jgi:flagellar assembly protein FliH